MKSLEQVTGNTPSARNFDRIDARLTQLAQHLFFGEGVPTFTPPGRALYVRLDGGTSTTLYVYEGASWVAK